jgi:murein DD-endopeptidase MepM/ murein hydrolase activator NlpD
MPDRLSFIVLGGSGKIVKQLHLSRSKVYGILGALILAAVILSLGLIDYFSIYSQSLNNEQLRKELAAQTQEVGHQRKQLQKFAEEINDLKGQIVGLSHFEQKIRAVTNLEEPDNVFGVGGSTPEDLQAEFTNDKRPSQLIKDMHQQVKQLSSATNNQENSFSVVLQTLIKRKNILSHTPIIQPAEGHITSPFGYRISPFTGQRELHAGLDIANREGTPIVAPANGVISFIGVDGAFGNIAVIDHGYGMVTRYGHLQKAVKKQGDPVAKGDTIALMGNSGRSTGPHVHYEVRLNGVAVNPKRYILN